jgi:D-tyrosyl-tRNA(Tyr) deacylase
VIALIQRVSQAEVVVKNQSIGKISCGLLAFIGVEKTDTKVQISKLLNKIIHYRIFADADDKMNLSVKNIQGGILLVPQFTLAADTKKGLRPSFSSSADPDTARKLFEQFVIEAKQQYFNIETGQFGADMQVSLLNDGPVTFILKT